MTRTHNMTTKDYYDKIIEPSTTHLCPCCGKALEFMSLRIGYRKYCSTACSAKMIANDESVKERREKTCLERYGVKQFLKSSRIDRSVNYGGTPESLEKIKKTKKERYGDENYNNIEKSRETKLEKYGDENFNNREKAAETLHEHYGVEALSPFSVPEINDKARKKCLERYGVEYVMQDHDFRMKAQRRKCKFDGKTFDSSWELSLYKFLKKNNLEFEYQPKTDFTYEWNGVKHHYTPDFKIGDQYIEIKGPQFFESGKMIDPYDRSKDGKAEKKLECMLSHGVKIVTDCKKFVKEIFSLKNYK